MSTIAERAAEREMRLAELRVERIRQQQIVAHIDFIATGVQHGFIPPDSVPLMLAEVFGTAEEVSNDRG